MCHARSDHLSVALGSKIYAIGGQSGNDNGVTSIESYDPCAETGWCVVVEDDRLAFRYDPSFSTIGASEVAVLGGFDPVRKMAFSEGYIFDAATNRLVSMTSNMVAY